MNSGMTFAIEQAKKCKIDVPVGCVIYYNNKIIASASFIASNTPGAVLQFAGFK